MSQPAPILIQGGRVIDPSRGVDEITDVLIEGGEIKGVTTSIPAPDGGTIIKATGLIVCPGFIDLHCHLREPGFEYKETIASGTAAAARGGFTTVCAMPNTNPVADNRATVDFVLRKGREEGVVRVIPIGAVTKGSGGTELAEMADLAHAGVVGFSDDGHPVSNPNIMRQALSYSSSLGLPIINHCEVKELSGDGTMNEGWVATRLGLKGIPSSAEEIMVARDIELAELTGGQLHIAHASTAGTADLLRRAKEEGLDYVTGEVTPHHLTLSDNAVLGDSVIGSEFRSLTSRAYDSNAKVAPPLRRPADVAAMVEALRDGVVSFVATDHAPHGRVEKLCSFEEADFGISGLETALGTLMSIVHKGDITLPILIERLTWGPAKFMGMTLGTLKTGSSADVAIFDPDTEWIVDAGQFVSKGKNTPLDGISLKGQIKTTIFGGKVVYSIDD